MALSKREEKSLVANDEHEFRIPRTRAPKKVLKEDEYVEDLEMIIVRDFYPELPKLKAQSEYLDAVSSNDVIKLRAIHSKYGPKRTPTSQGSLYNTPATFETPESRPGSTPKPDVAAPPAVDASSAAAPSEASTVHNPELPVKRAKTDGVSLDGYLGRHTSEDNQSFADILDDTKRKIAAKHAWLFEQEDEKREDREAALALPSIESQAALTGPRTQEIQTWDYKARNPLMYFPEGKEFTRQELIEIKAKRRAIEHVNTRFDTTPWDARRSACQLAQAAEAKACQASRVGKIGVDGREILPSDTPSVKGYKFMGTPSPAPGVNESPLMTWGEIEGTPFRLDGGDTPKRAGPSYEPPKQTRREQLAIQLADDASKQHRAKKEQALKHVARLHTPGSKMALAARSSRSGRISTMSPAAKRLASSKLGIRPGRTDSALRASYTPTPGRATPSRRTPKDKTPVITPKRTPKAPVTTPAPSTPQAAEERVESLTDNLLQIPKRKTTAADFF